MSAPPPATPESTTGRASRRRAERVPGHATLPRYYGTDDKRVDYVNTIFDNTAHHYDTIEALLLNGALWYRRFCLKRAGLGPGMKVLDVAIGTGAVARGAVELVGPTGQVIGVDPSPNMLAQARTHFRGPLSRGIAEQLPFPDDHFDFVTMGIALRHVSDLVATFSEYFRVLKPGGTMWILEGHAPANPAGRRLMRLMMYRMVPGMTLLATRSREAKEFMEFYWDTVEQSATPRQILDIIEQVGFDPIQHNVLSPICEYIGRKP
jgi:demethylmenaquinone methyltransferase/2-methoxy-6-polyprenyl-1,4-benzoquinol methylase